jgi:hypothetical protein
MQVTLSNGVTIEGDQLQVKELLTQLGYANTLGTKQVYFSATKGPILIKDMETTHLRNAILKYYQEWVNELHKVKNPKEIVNKILDGITNETWQAMLTEYSRRKEV